MSDRGRALKQRFAKLRVRVVMPELRDILPADSRGEPAVYGRPFTLADSAKLQQWIDADSPEGFAQVIISHAVDEAGERLFDLEDRQIFIQCVEAHIVTRLAKGLMASIDLDTAAGNSDAIRS